MKRPAPYTELISRRRALGLFGATATLLGCGGGGSEATSTSMSTSTATPSTGGSVSCVLTPEETAGPYPLFDDIATASTYMREDITEGKTGVPLRLLLTFVNVNSNCAPITDALVYTWHCDKDGAYSGRITHAHFRVYLGNSLEATSQLAFPQEITRAVYGSSLYVGRGQNTSVTSFSADNVFSDGEQYQLSTITENASIGGYDAALTVGISL